MDVSKRHVLCLAALPPGYQLSRPVKPIISQAANAQMLYLRGMYSVQTLFYNVKQQHLSNNIRGMYSVQTFYNV